MPIHTLPIARNLPDDELTLDAVKDIAREMGVTFDDWASRCIVERTAAQAGKLADAGVDPAQASPLRPDDIPLGQELMLKIDLPDDLLTMDELAGIAACSEMSLSAWAANCIVEYTKNHLDWVQDPKTAAYFDAHKALGPVNLDPEKIAAQRGLLLN